MKTRKISHKAPGRRRSRTSNVALPALVTAAGGLAISSAAALELGELQVQSSLGQPLRATIAYALSPNEKINDSCVAVRAGGSSRLVPDTAPGAAGPQERHYSGVEEPDIDHRRSAAHGTDAVRQHRGGLPLLGTPEPQLPAVHQSAGDAGDHGTPAESRSSDGNDACGARGSGDTLGAGSDAHLRGHALPGAARRFTVRHRASSRNHRHQQRRRDRCATGNKPRRFHQR